MLANGHTLIQLMEELAPKHYAVEGDKIGLQVGTLNKPIAKVLIALDVTDEVVEEAIAAGANLIIAHHAVIYRPLAKLDFSTPGGRLFEKLIKHDIAVYIAHTNLDVADGGINDAMAQMLGLEGRGTLDEVHNDQLFKLAVFVPKTHSKQVQEAIWQAGAGQIGHYSSCSFTVEGTGTFRPGAGATPYIGEQGRLESVEEVRVETIVSGAVKRKVVQALLKAHPYEEVAYDLYPMDMKGRSFGLGRVGKLPEAISLRQLAEQVKSAFDVPALRVVGNLESQVRKVAVLGGSGGRYVSKALFAGADVLVTGDIDYHTAQDALVAGLAIIDPGHNIEKLMKPLVADWLAQRLRERSLMTEVAASEVSTEVFQFI
ncbi:Nif3-like dinuclear metal center hexameric protein [Paenibacillus sp. SYP-B4298]|uniref:Nif3-like dinuclear metal center hexameric protein n=1 Tax=Paenibacillus sp. SYP-B4298 TaxID=2996034 RepID=UPI0022DD8F88|nr:Nif3-like dinuclear metal center hexameric protein [Paenibacillus sp. SYP-B4298]